MAQVQILSRTAGLLFLGLVLARGQTAPTGERSGWGVDACLTAHVDAKERASYLRLLRASRVGWLRERAANPALAKLKAGGFGVAAFLNLGPLPVTQPGDALPENLLAVFRAAQAMQRRYGRWVDAWEMVGEPDVGYCHDLADRVVAFQKAVYLGIKSAGPNPPIVLMGALALPPGPWLERAARNGLFDYTDADNIHFYGFANDLAGVIRAHEAFAARWVDVRGRKGAGDMTGQRPLSTFPIWITECGLDAVRPEAFLNAERRRLQADFTVTTAEVARQAREVAVFMPFVLVDAGDPYALTLAPDRPLPAWTAYADYMRQHPFPTLVRGLPPRNPNPIVLQWMPDNRTTIPHKVSGCYRFRRGQPMRGAIRAYNFSTAPVAGRLCCRGLAHVHMTCPALKSGATNGRAAGERITLRSDEVVVPAMGQVEFPLEFLPDAPGYFRENWEGAFVGDRGRRSPIEFGLETIPVEGDLCPVPLVLEPGDGKVDHPDLDGDAVSSTFGAWVGINGLRVEGRGNSKSAVGLTLSLPRPADDPLWPPVAIARIHGLPRQCFLRLQLDPPIGSGSGLRLDLIDRRGQRFTVWENFGADYSGPTDDVWLSLDDFGVYFWGRCSERPTLDPSTIEEIRLRPYFARGCDRQRLRLSLWRDRVAPTKQMPGAQ